MSRNEDFFATKKAAAVFKHGILYQYPVVFASKAGMTVRDRRVTFLDGYAGRGRYEKGEPGSPLLLVESAKQVQAFRNVRGIFVERDDDNFANLSQVLREQSGSIETCLFNQSLDECLSEILEMVKDDALFAFLDPFGPALDFTLLVSGLLGRPWRPPTEVLLHFSVLSVARMAGALRRAQETGGALSGATRKTADRLNRFLGGEWWQEYFAGAADESRATDAALKVADRYRERVNSETGFMSVSMPVRPRPDLLPKYVLVLFTRHPEGVWCFADALGHAGKAWHRAWMTETWNHAANPQQGSLFGDDPLTFFDPDQYERESKDGWTKTIAENILRLAKSRPFRLTDRVTEVYGTTLGSARILHVKAAVKLLNRQGLILNDGKGEGFHNTLIRCQ